MFDPKVKNFKANALTAAMYIQANILNKGKPQDESIMQQYYTKNRKKEIELHQINVNRKVYWKYEFQTFLKWYNHNPGSGK